LLPENRQIVKSANRQVGNLAKDSRPKLHYAGFSLQAKIFGRVSSEWRIANGFDHPQSKRQRMANSEREWQLAISDWWMTFLEGKKWEGEIPAEPKRQRVANGE
jgi:hypothetical protein